MRVSSLLIFTVVLIIAFYALPISSKAVKQTTTVATTTKPAPTVKVSEKAPVNKPGSKDGKKKAPASKSKKTQTSSWKVPDAAQKKLFNDYKNILHEKLVARKHVIDKTYQLEPIRYGSQQVEKTTLHHFLIKLPDSKYAHAIIGINKDAKKPTLVNENNASIRRTIYDNLEAAEA